MRANGRNYCINSSQILLSNKDQQVVHRGRQSAIGVIALFSPVSGCVWCVTEPAHEMSEEEKMMMNVMGFYAFSTTKVWNYLPFYFL